MDLIPQHDYDGIFLQGLLPEMKAMDFRQKIIFKRRIYEVLGEIFDNNSTQASSTTNQAHGELAEGALYLLRYLHGLLVQRVAAVVPLFQVGDDIWGGVGAVVRGRLSPSQQLISPQYSQACPGPRWT